MTKKLDCNFMEITPEMARDFLNKNRKNRKVNENRVRAYAATMKRGEWFALNQGIAFDTSGNLLDGQHRLMAIIHAKKPVTMLIVRGLDSASQLVIDRPLIRQFHDQIGLQKGMLVTSTGIAIAKAMMVGGIETRYHVLQDETKDILIVDRYYTKHRRAIEFALSCFPKSRLRNITVAPVMAAIARAYYNNEYHERLREFGNVLFTGLSQSQSDAAAILLRNYLMTEADSTRTYKGRAIVYKRTEIALRGFLNNESVSQTRRVPWDKEIFPISGDKTTAKILEPRLVKTANIASI